MTSFVLYSFLGNLQIVCKFPCWDFTDGDSNYVHVRVNAFSPNWTPRVAPHGVSAHFMPGQLIMGFIDGAGAKCNSDQLATWDFLDYEWAGVARPWYIASPWMLRMRPSLDPKIPLLADGNFANALILGLSIPPGSMFL